MGRLRIALSAEVSPESGVGGVSSVVAGLVAALGRLDGPEEYLVITSWQSPAWIAPHLGANQRLVIAPRPLQDRAKALLGGLRPAAARLRRRVVRTMAAPRPVRVPVSDGFYEGLSCQVIHFPFQVFAICALPTIYNPHDLQHLHHPEFFSPGVLAWRTTVYPAGCRAAHTVVVASEWVKEDVLRHFEIPREKVQVIPWAPPTQVHRPPTDEDLAEARGTYGLTEPFAFYPSVTWPHKNHLRLLEALARLRDREQLRVRLVCTGFKNDHWPVIERRIEALRLGGQVQFLGVVPALHLRALYRLAQFVVIPTLFEAASGPLMEAWEDGAPVACSNVTSLPEQAADAALLFDPLSVDVIARAVARMATDPGLRADLVRRGARRLRDFSWERTAKAYRAVYRRAAGRPLTEEDRWLLSWNWMREPTASGPPS
ncbi:MAG: glycosyltransferase family 1 protein [Armatimonadota bacterium]|nr:glycosyltransferase family 1 protein [Armatimonadota bacterium]MDR7496642.1 glycosyltransferase family 1 protein [Armatimonadota bacterium]